MQFLNNNYLNKYLHKFLESISKINYRSHKRRFNYEKILNK